MNSLFRLVGLNISDLKRRGLWMIGGGMVAAIFATLTVGFLGVALYVSLLERMTPLSAALVIAGGSFVLCILTLILAKWASRPRKDASAALRTSAVTALSPMMLKLAARHTGIVGAVAVVVATLAYLEGRRK